jgi:hypothetical protein
VSEKRFCADWLKIQPKHAQILGICRSPLRTADSTGLQL